MRELKISDKLSLPLDAVTQVFAFLGRRSSGKTYGSTKLAELMLEAKAQVVALDVVGVWYGLRLAKDGKSPGFPIPVFGGLHGDVPIDSHAGALVADLIVDRDYSAVIDISQMIASEQTRFAYDFATQLFQRKKSKPSAMHVFLEESQEVCPQNVMRGDAFGAKMLHAFERMVKLGRNFGIGVSLISQRPQEVNKKVLNQAECLFAFQMTGPQERKAVEGWTADKGVDEDIYTLLSKLEIGSPRVWSPQWLRVSETIRIAEKKTYDASSTPKVGAKPVEVKQLSPVDIEQITGAMKAVVEKAKADDPKALRKRIAELERELLQAGGQGPDKRLQEQEGRHQRELDALERQAQKDYDSMVSIYEKALEELRGRLRKIAGLANYDDSPVATPVKVERPKITHSPRVVVEERVPTSKPLTRQISQRAAAEGISRPQQSILDALAWFESVGIDAPTRSNVAAIAGVSPRSSSFANNISALRAQHGFIEYRADGCLSLTTAGRAASNESNTPLTLAQLHDAWVQSKALSNPHRQILQALLEIYPREIDRESLAERLGVSARSSSYANNISRLSSLGLLTYPRQGVVRANGELLFPAGLR